MKTFKSRVKTDGVSMPVFIGRENPSESTPFHILSEMVDKHHEVLLDYLLFSEATSDVALLSKPHYRNLLVFGSLMLVPLSKYLENLLSRLGLVLP